MKAILITLLILANFTLFAQSEIVYSENPFLYTDAGATPEIQKLITAFKKDSSLNGEKLSPVAFASYLETIQNSTVFLSKFKLSGKDTQTDFLEKYREHFIRIDKSPLFCSCHNSRFILNQNNELVENEKGEQYKVLFFDVGEESFSDLAFGIFVGPNGFTSIFTHYDNMNYSTLKSDMTKGELKIIPAESQQLTLQKTPDDYMIGNFSMISRALATENALESRFEISGEFSCKIE